jgi:hypothetical protein
MLHLLCAWSNGVLPKTFARRLRIRVKGFLEALDQESPLSCKFALPRFPYCPASSLLGRRIQLNPGQEAPEESIPG